jgi:Rad3-related DNA helicase
MPVKIDPELKLPAKFKEWRDDQYTALKTITQSDKPFFLADLPTGLGKSLIGVGTQRILKQRLIYLTGTKQLQDQVEHDFGDIVVTLKGRANYPCRIREDVFPEITAEDCRAGKPRECEYYSECEYYQQKERARQADIVVLNNAYFLNEVNGFQSAFDGAGILVVDEVDSLDNALMNYIEFKITSRQLEHYHLLLPDDPQVKESWLKWIPGAINHLEQQVSDSESRLHQCGFQNWGKTEIQENKKKKAMQKLIDKLSFIASEADQNWIFYYEENKEKGYEFNFRPINVAKYAHRYLWDHAEYKVGMSGTIFSAEITCRELGIEDCDYLSLESPFLVENRPIYYKPVVNLSKKTMSNQLPLLQKAIDQDLLKYPDQKVLIHTVSYQLRNYLRDTLTCQERLMTHESDDREEALESFKSSRSPLVMLSPSFDRGVDLPEADNCGAVMVCKMPYLYLGDPQVKAKVDLPGGWAWYALKACQTLVQMTGRSVRSPRQRCDTIIYDAQFSRLRSRMQEILPVWWQAAIREIDPGIANTGLLI